MNKKIFLFLVLALFFISFTSAELTENITSYYKLDGTSGSVTDSIGNYDGTNVGASRGSDGKINKSFLFDGSNDKVTISTAYGVGNSNFSVSFWVNITNTSQGGAIVKIGGQAGEGSANDGIGIGVGGSTMDDFGNDIILIYENVRWIDTNTNIGTGWHHIVITIDSSSVPYVYLDGNFINSYSGTSMIAPTVESFIGGYSASGGNERYFDGKIDEVGIWSRVLTTNEISELYNSGLGLSYPFISKDISIDLISPTNNSKESGNISFQGNLNFTSINSTNVTLKIWYSNNTIFKSISQNISVNNSNITVNFNNINGFSSGQYYWNILGVGTNGTNIISEYAENNFTFEWRPFDVNLLTFNNNSIETDTQNFTINITTLQNILSVSAFINYDNILSLSATSCNNLGTCIINNNIDVTTITNGGQFQNKSFFWQISVFDGENSFSFNTTENNQTLERIFLEQCNATFTTKTLSFDSKDEQNLTQISSFDFDSTLRIWKGSGTQFRNITFNKTSLSVFDICIQPTNETFFIDMDSNYQDSAKSYTQRDYFLENKSINNQTQNITLLLLLEGDSTSFIIETKEDSQAVIDGALVIIEKYYPGEDIYRTTQIIKTDENGQSIAFLEAENVDYRFTIIKDGIQLLQTENRKAFSEETPFKITLIVTDTIEAPWQDFEDLGNLEHQLYHNQTTNIIYFTYVDSSLDFDFSRLLVKINPPNSSSIIICNKTSILSSATLSCNVSIYTDIEISAQAYIYRNSQENFIDGIKFSITDSVGIFGLEGLFLACLLIMVGYGLSFVNINLGLITGMVTVVLINFTKLVSLPSEVIYGVVAITILAIAMVNRR